MFIIKKPYCYIFFYILSAFFIFVLFLKSCRVKTQDFDLNTLRILGWEGFLTSDLVFEFEKDNKISIIADYAKSYMEFIDKAKSNNYDVIMLSSFVYQEAINQKLVSPIIYDSVPNAKGIIDEFKSYIKITDENKVYGIPFSWGYMSILYNKAIVNGEPKSWQDMASMSNGLPYGVWKSRLDHVIRTAISLGLSNKENFNDNQIKLIKEELLKNKDNIIFWSDSRDIINMFLQNKAVISTGWNSIYNQLKKLNFPCGISIADEGTTGWIHYLCVSSKSAKRDKSLRFINYYINENTQKKFLDHTGYATTTKSCQDFLIENDISDLKGLLSKIYFGFDIKNPYKIRKIWEEIFNHGG